MCSLLPLTLRSHLTPPRLLALLRLSKQTLFPSGYPAPPPVDPTPPEAAALRASLVQSLLSRVPAPVRVVLLGYGEGEKGESVVEGAVECFGDQGVNMHLAVVLLDAVLLAVFPEMGVEGLGG